MRNPVSEQLVQSRPKPGFFPDIEPPNPDFMRNPVSEQLVQSRPKPGFFPDISIKN